MHSCGADLSASVCLQMADVEQHEDSIATGGHEKDEDNGKIGNGCLQNFITEQYEQQRKAGAMEPTSELNDERTANFFNRALAESQRMSQEVSKSKQKLEKLKVEFGDEMIAAWHNEHAAEVLTPPEQRALQRAEDGAYA